MSVKNYQIKLTTVGPVHIGSGNKHNKKDYYPKDEIISIIDVAEFYKMLSAVQRDKYQDFLNTSSGMSLLGFLEANDLFNIAEKATSYKLSAKLQQNGNGIYTFVDVFEFIKDTYGYPYVPGSSVKGMLRTAILASAIINDRSEYEGLYHGYKRLDIKRRNTATDSIEKKLFERIPNNSKEPIDIMRYISVSDSKPLAIEALAFVTKYDKFSLKDDGSHKIRGDSEGNQLNIYRECLKPGTVVELTLSIDDRINEYISIDGDKLRSMLRQFTELYKSSLLDFYITADDGLCQFIHPDGLQAGKRCQNRAIGDTGYCTDHKDNAQDKNNVNNKQILCYIGGGVGFTSKTVINALFNDDKRRVNEVSRFLYKQHPTKLVKAKQAALRKKVQKAGFKPEVGKKNDPRHWRDNEFGVSPHTLKMGKVDGELLQMGLCRIEITEIT